MSEFTSISLCSKRYKTYKGGHESASQRVFLKQIVPFASCLILIWLAFPLEFFLCWSVNGLVNLRATLLIVLNLYNLIKRWCRIRSESSRKQHARGQGREDLKANKRAWALIKTPAS